MKKVLVLAVLAALVPSGVLRAATEPPPTFDARELAPGLALTGPGYAVEPRVPTDGFYGLFAVRSRFGLVTARGVDQLRVRIHEQGAIELLAETTRRQAVVAGAGDSARQTVDSARHAAADPIGTVAAVPEGVGRLFASVGKRAAQRVGAASGADGGKESSESKAGLARVRRELAQRLDVDPYTDNPLLAPRLDEVAREIHLGGMAVNVATGAASVWLGAAARSANLVWTQPPENVRAANAQQLQEFGVDGTSAARFLDSTAFTPTARCLLLDAIDMLGPVPGRELLVTLAGDMRSRDEARYLVAATRMAGLLRRSGETFARVERRGDLFVLLLRDGALVVPVPVDYLSFTEALERCFTGEDASRPARQLVTGGGLSPLAASELAKRGIAVRRWREPAR